MKDRRYKNCSRGVVLIEAAILIPIVLLLSISGIEVARALKSIQVASQLGREAASIAFRECGGDRGAVLSSCLNDVQQSLSFIEEPFGVGIQMIVTLVVFDGGGITEARASAPTGTKTSGVSASLGTSIVSITQEGQSAKTLSLGGEPRTIAIGEVWVKFDQVIPMVWGQWKEWYGQVTVI